MPHRSAVDEGPGLPPIPTQVVSNGEFYPLPKTHQQRQIDERLTERADRSARRLGLSRRAFLRTACGMAAAMLSIEEVWAAASGRRGRRWFPGLREEHARDPEAAREVLDGTTEFVFDVQTHHVDADGDWVRRNPAMLLFLGAFPRPRVDYCRTTLECLGQQNFLNEVFLLSDTSMCLLSGVPTRSAAENILPPVQMAATRDWVNDLAGTRRMLSHGLVRPNLDPRRNLADMRRQARNLKVASWKAYTGATLERSGWWLDDEKIAYPMYDLSLRLGINNFCVHKGLPLGVFDAQYVRPRDVSKASRDWPEMNFILYHSAYPYVDELVAQRALTPNDNVYCELGSTFAQTVVANPNDTAHVMGKLLRTFGARRIVWGTDSIWWGSPDWQIKSFLQFQIPDEIAESSGYPQLALEDRRRILGLNSAALYDIDVDAARAAFADDGIARMKQAAAEVPLATNGPYGPADIEAARRLMRE